MVGFLLLSFITSESISNDLLTVNKVLSLILPLTIIAAGISGVYDAKIRFKKLSPPYLKIKIYLGSLSFILSIIMLFLFMWPSYTLITKVLLVIFAMVNLGLCVVLGKMGGKLIDSVMPG